MRITTGCVVEARTSLHYPTGNWRLSRPDVDRNICTGCGLCAEVCPEGCILPEEGRSWAVDLNYCKGCGICAFECPAGAIQMIGKEGES